MSRPVKSFGQGDPEISEYAEKLFKPIDSLLALFRERSRAAGLPEIQVGPMDGRHLEILSRMMMPKRAIEIGTLGGYSGLCILRGMPAGAVLHSFEKSELHARVASENLELAKKEHAFAADFKIHVGSALDGLRKVEQEGPFDFVFIDADKPGYPAYLDWTVENLRKGGVVIGDNTFAWGEVHRANSKTGNDLLQVGSLHEFNRRMAENPRLRSTIFPTAEGLTVGVKVD